MWAAAIRRRTGMPRAHFHATRSIRSSSRQSAAKTGAGAISTTRIFDFPSAGAINAMNRALLITARRAALPVAASLLWLIPALPAVAQAQKAACSAPEYRQFDFWIGDWDAFDVSDPKTSTAHIRIESILDGCVIKETYDGANGAKGQSFSVFDRTRGVWHQTWVTNRGRLLTIEGKFEGGAIALSGVDRTDDGKDRKVRGVWKPEAGGVRETADTSLDGGATWTEWFDLMFRPHAKAGVPSR